MEMHPRRMYDKVNAFRTVQILRYSHGMNTLLGIAMRAMNIAVAINGM